MNRLGFARVDRAFFINRIAEHVHDPSERFFSDRDRNRFARIRDVETPRQPLRGSHGNRADNAIAQLLLHL